MGIRHLELYWLDIFTDWPQLTEELRFPLNSKLPGTDLIWLFTKLNVLEPFKQFLCVYNKFYLTKIVFFLNSEICYLEALNSIQIQLSLIERKKNMLLSRQRVIV